MGIGTNFKVGDKVRIINKAGISGRYSSFKNGDIIEIIDAGVGGIIAENSCGKTIGIFPEEYATIELVSDNLTQNQRISALESQVAELQAELSDVKKVVEALNKTQGKTYTVGVDFAKPTLTPNQKRKAIIDEAKAFVEENLAKNHRNAASDGVWFISEGGQYSITDKAEFIVNSEKRVVVALIKGVRSNSVYTKAIAKCAPDDVFNANIGKAIALGRALGLDVARFEQAVKPTEYEVGQTVHSPRDNRSFKVVSEFSFNADVLSVNYCRQMTPGLAIIDDTEAQYV